MYTQTPTGNESPVTTADSTDDAIRAFVASVTDVLDELGADDEAVATVKATGEQLVGRVREDQDRRDSERDHAAKERAELAGRVSDAEEALDGEEDGEDPASDGQTSTGDGSNPPTQAPQTPLGDCVTLPETVAEQELTANIKRARDVAADVVDYGRSVPAGYAITAVARRKPTALAVG